MWDIIKTYKTTSFLNTSFIVERIRRLFLIEPKYRTMIKIRRRIDKVNGKPLIYERFYLRIKL